MTKPELQKNKISESSPDPVLAQAQRPAVNWAVAGIGVCALASLLVILTWNLSKTRKAMHEMGMLMTSQDVKVIEMKGMDPNLKATGRVIRQPGSQRCFFIASGLEAIPQGKIYELWAIQGETPVPMGTFRVDRHGCAMMNLSTFRSMEQFEKFTVTLEPSGGVPAPTGPLYLSGSF